MSKRKYIILGIAFLLLAVFCYVYIIYACTQVNDVQVLLEDRNAVLFLALVACVFSGSLGLGEAMFIRAQIVPKGLRLLFYLQWGVSGFALAVSLIHILTGGTLGEL